MVLNHIEPPFTDEIRWAISQRLPVALTGHTGSGKTSLIYHLAATHPDNPKVHRANLNGQMTVSDLIGTWIVKDGQTQWVNGILPTAMINGDWVIFDEVDYGDPDILGATNGVLEPGGSLVLKEKGNEVIKPHPNFRIFCTGNTLGNMSRYRPLYQGTVPLNEAYMDRWHLWQVDYLPPVDEARLLVERTGITLHLAEKLVKFAGKAREAFEKQDVLCSFSTRRLIDYARLIYHYRLKGKKSLVLAAGATWANKIAPDDREKLMDVLDKIMELKETPAA